MPSTIETAVICATIAAIAAKKAHRKGVHMNNNTIAISTAAPAVLPVNITRKKIGNATYIVTTRFNGDKSHDMVKSIRLIGRDGGSFVETPKMTG
jgi:hypothetical protein